MLQGDVASVLEIERRVYSQPWSEAILRDELGQPQRSYIVAVDDEQNVVGYGGVLLLGEDAHITTIAVDGSARGHRLGTRLMLELVEAALKHRAQHLTLEVRSSNRRAQSLYGRFGMAPVGVRKNYYIDEDALIMWVNNINDFEYQERIDSIKADLERLS
jgi:ribosomal-protein-alanine N-acetyltransferase